MHEPHALAAVCTTSDHLCAGVRVRVVRLLGEHDIASVGDVARALGEADGRPLVLDLADCAFLDSSVAAQLLLVRARRGRLDVVLPSAGATVVRRSLELMGVLPLIDAHEDVASGTIGASTTWPWQTSALPMLAGHDRRGDPTR